jgi:hypothetical protein
MYLSSNFCKCAVLLIMFLYMQSLWHIRRFQDEFLKTSSLHKHVEDPCTVCALYEIFIDLSKAEKGQGEAVAPSSLRIALSKSYPNSKFFQEVKWCPPLIVEGAYVHYYRILLSIFLLYISFWLFLV